MKPNLEITLKFWIALIVFFAVVLFIPFCEYLSDNYSVIICTITAFIYVSTFIFCIDLLLRNSELKSKLRKESFYRTVSAQTIDDYEHQIKLQECQIEDRKKYFEDAVAEITELRSKSEKCRDRINHLGEELTIANERIEVLKVTVKELHEMYNEKEQIAMHWKERALHKKHTKKEVDSDYWKCINQHYLNFNNGQTYKKSGDSICDDKRLVWLFEHEDHLHPYLVEKKYFKAVKL